MFSPVKLRNLLNYFFCAIKTDLKRENRENSSEKKKTPIIWIWVYLNHNDFELHFIRPKKAFIGKTF